MAEGVGADGAPTQPCFSVQPAGMGQPVMQPSSGSRQFSGELIWIWKSTLVLASRRSSPADVPTETIGCLGNGSTQPNSLARPV